MFLYKQESILSHSTVFKRYIRFPYFVYLDCGSRLFVRKKTNAKVRQSYYKNKSKIHIFPETHPTRIVYTNGNSSTASAGYIGR